MKIQILGPGCAKCTKLMETAEAAAKAGFTHVFNVLEGFEGEIDADQHRGGSDGWRYRGLPWVQD